MKLNRKTAVIPHWLINSLLEPIFASEPLKAGGCTQWKIFEEISLDYSIPKDKAFDHEIHQVETRWNHQ